MNYEEWKNSTEFERINKLRFSRYGKLGVNLNEEDLEKYYQNCFDEYKLSRENDKKFLKLQPFVRRKVISVSYWDKGEREVVSDNEILARIPNCSLCPYCYTYEEILYKRVLVDDNPKLIFRNSNTINKCNHSSLGSVILEDINIIPSDICPLYNL